MKILYHIDRSKQLKQGESIELTSVEGNDNKYKYAGLFGEMFSYHGLNYLANKNQVMQGVLLNNTFPPFFSADVIDNSLKELNSKLIEIMAECIRQQSFPNHLSRFQAMFVTDAESIEKWIQEDFGNDYKIFEIEVEDEKVHKFDGRYLRGGVSLNVMEQGSFLLDFMNDLVKELYDYWDGNISENPKFEYLVELPVVIGREVTLDEINKNNCFRTITR